MPTFTAESEKGKKKKKKKKKKKRPERRSHGDKEKNTEGYDVTDTKF